MRIALTAALSSPPPSSPPARARRRSTIIQCSRARRSSSLPMASIGQAHFTEGLAGVMIRLELAEPGLTPGWHGLHPSPARHCSDFAAGFQNAGGHIGTHQGVHHGLMDPEGPEAGDPPNLFCRARSALRRAILFAVRHSRRSRRGPTRTAARR